MESTSVEKMKKTVMEKAYRYERDYHCCSQATLLALQEALGLEDELTLKAASALCGGVAMSGGTCGALSAGVMALGMKQGRGDLKEGFAPVMEAMVPAYKLVKWFESEYGTTTCREISGIEMNGELLNMMAANPEESLKTLDPEEVEKCSRICGKIAEKVIDILAKEQEGAS
jgi:C_GCAxxG_C_C family probable redox protein